MINGKSERALRAMKEGELIILIDDIHAGIGALVGAAQHVTPKKVNIMTKVGKGLISVCLKEERAKTLNLPLMVEDSRKPFTVSIDYKTCTTGISSFERADTIKALTREDVQPDDFRKPGHIFPLAGKELGVLQRVDLVEAVIDLANMTTSSPVGYLCEILNQQGKLASEQEMINLSHEYGFPILKLSELVNMRTQDVICMFSGKVIRGNQIGRKIGFPTANLYVNEENALLQNGVYGVQVNYGKREFLGIMNVGVRPTIRQDESSVHFEVHIFDFDEMIYDQILQIKVGFFVREEISFSSIDQLISQIEKDMELVKNRWQAAGIGGDRPLLIGGVV